MSATLSNPEGSRDAGESAESREPHVWALRKTSGTVEAAICQGGQGEQNGPACGKLQVVAITAGGIEP